MSSDLYRETIIDHYQNPRNYGVLKNPDIKAKDSNPLCGDEVEIQIKLDSNSRVEDVRFNGKGCAISLASASMLTEMIVGMNVDELRALDKEKVLKTLGTPNLGPVRIKCALLPLKTLKVGLYSYLGNMEDLKEE